MKFPSNSLSIFRFHGGVQQPDDSDMDVESRIFPTISIPRALAQAEDSTFPTLNDSGIISRGAAFGPSGAGATAPVVTLGAGLWEIQIYWSLSANFQFTTNFDIFGTMNAINFTLVRIGSSIGAGSNPTPGIVNNGVWGPWRLALNTPMIVSFVCPATGLSQAISCWVNVAANRLG